MLPASLTVHKADHFHSLGFWTQKQSCCVTRCEISCVVVECQTARKWKTITCILTVNQNASCVLCISVYINSLLLLLFSNLFLPPSLPSSPPPCFYSLMLFYFAYVFILMLALVFTSLFCFVVWKWLNCSQDIPLPTQPPFQLPPWTRCRRQRSTPSTSDSFHG